MLLKPIAERILEEESYEDLEVRAASGRRSGVVAFLAGLVTAAVLVGMGAAMAFAWLGVPLADVFVRTPEIVVSGEGTEARDRVVGEKAAGAN